MATPASRRRVLVLVLPGAHGATVSSAVARAVSAALPPGAATVSVDVTAAPMVHLVAVDTGPVSDPVLQQARLAGAASGLQAAVARVDCRGVDVTWEAVQAADVQAWANACVRDGQFDALVLAGTDAADLAEWRAALPVPVLAGS